MVSGKNAVQINPKTGRHYPNKRFVEWRSKFASAFNEFVKQYSKTFPIDYPVSVTILYTPGDKRRRDVPGMEDALWHLLEYYKIVEDDKYLGGWGNYVSFAQKTPEKGVPAEVKVIIHDVEVR